MSDEQDAGAHTVRELVFSLATAPSVIAALCSDEPMVIRGLISDWPVVASAAKGPAAVSAYLQSIYSGEPVGVLRGEPAIRGKFFYREDMRGVNFGRTDAPFDVAMQVLMAEMKSSDPASIFLQSLPMTRFFPGFMEQNHLTVLDQSIAPRIWIGNALTVQTHFDLQKNIACLVTGKRRFTLFPPDQLPNLYIGPLDLTPSGVPVSMVNLDAPDYTRHPRFRTALEQKRVVSLEPGDAIYIPFGWWHHVESLTDFNILVNYWWSDGKAQLGAFDSLLHAVAALRDLPEYERTVWRSLFDYFVFETSGEALGHLPKENRGAMGEMTAPRLAEIKSFLLKGLR